MLRATNNITALLVVIVIILIFGVGIAVYYVLDLDWFDKKQNPVSPYIEQNFVKPYKEENNSYDMSKRTYDILVNTDELRVVVHKDGKVGITLLSNDANSEVEVYKEILEKEVMVDVKNIVKAYTVEASNEDKSGMFIVLLDKEGHVYKLNNEKIGTDGKYVIEKLEGLAKIVDVKQITNESLVENINGINVIVIDEEANELLLTDYLLK